MNNIKKGFVVLLMTFSMNMSGQLTKYINNFNGSVKQIINRESSYSGPITIIKEYNRDGFLEAESVYSGNEFNTDSLKRRRKFSYKLDNKKRISEVLIINKEKEKSKKVIKYKSKFYTINTLWRENRKWKKYDDGIDQFTYNHKEYKTKVVLEFGLFNEYYKWNKDKTQLLQMRFETNEEGWEEYTYNYTYNDNNCLMYEEYQACIDSIFGVDFYVDSVGNIYNKSVFIRTESNSFNTEYKYDEYDNCIETKKIQYDGSVSIISFLIKYDKQNNWIQKEEYKDEILRDVQTREIIYF